MAARYAGMDCELLFAGPPPAAATVNIELARAVGARLHFGAAPSREQLDDTVLAHAEFLRASGRRPYAVPRGGATAVGAAGYAFAAQELAGQCGAMAISPAVVVVATGSGATQAGLVAGQVGFGCPWRTIGASVSRPLDDMQVRVLRLARECATELGLAPATTHDVDVRDQIGAGFGIASEEDRLNAHLALTREALLLDDYYGAKALTLLRVELAQGCSTPVVFWHTGGVSAALSALTRGAHP